MESSVARAGLGTEQLTRVYARLARRYDVWHGLLTARSDQRGRALLVQSAVRAGDVVLDCGAGTGSTALLAARAAGPTGAVTLYDLTDAMLAQARRRFARRRGMGRVAFRCGDMSRLPYDDDSFDVVLSTYSLCPVADPALGAREMFRVTRPGGLIGAAHSTEPSAPLVRALSRRVEAIAWRFPLLSMGCRAVEVLPTLREAGGEVLVRRHLGVPLWPFLLFVVRKPA